MPDMLFPWDDARLKFAAEIISLLFVLAVLCFIVSYSLHIRRNQWTIRKSTQYALLTFVPLGNLLSAFLLHVCISLPFALLSTGMLVLNDHDKINGFAFYENQGISSVLKRYQDAEKRDWLFMTEAEKQDWRKIHCKNPILLKKPVSFLIGMGPYVMGFCAALLVVLLD